MQGFGKRKQKQIKDKLLPRFLLLPFVFMLENAIPSVSLLQKIKSYLKMPKIMLLHLPVQT